MVLPSWLHAGAPALRVSPVRARVPVEVASRRGEVDPAQVARLFNIVTTV